MSNPPEFSQNPEPPFQSPPGDTGGVPGKGGPQDPEARQMAMFAHLSGIVASMFTGMSLGFIGPLIIWMVKKDESEFVADQAKEALNFQLTLMILVVVCYGVTIVTCGFLFPVLGLPFVLQIVFGIISGMKANEGEYYRYPLNIRFIN